MGTQYSILSFQYNVSSTGMLSTTTAIKKRQNDEALTKLLPLLERNALREPSSKSSITC